MSKLETLNKIIKSMTEGRVTKELETVVYLDYDDTYGWYVEANKERFYINRYLSQEWKMKNKGNKEVDAHITFTVEYIPGARSRNPLEEPDDPDEHNISDIVLHIEGEEPIDLDDLDPNEYKTKGWTELNGILDNEAGQNWPDSYEYEPPERDDRDWDD